MTFQLMRLQPNPAALAEWAARYKLLSRDGDYGYALHALLTTAFGTQAPKPFRYLDAKQGLLAYTAESLDTLMQHASLAAPDVARALGLDSLDARAFPTTWKAGQTIGFETRVRPTVRLARRRGERDAFSHALESAEAAGQSAEFDRETVYKDWLTKQFVASGAVDALQLEVTEFQQTRVFRKGAADAEGSRKVFNNAGPDAVIKGVLRITNPEAFTKLLARGVGRHRAFGFGMLLLKPVATL